MASALFFLISWALSTGLQPKMTDYVFVAYLGIGGVSSSSPSHSTSYLTFNIQCLSARSALSPLRSPPSNDQLFTIPLLPLIVFNYPRRYNRIWQPILAGASWVLADVVIIEAYRCHFFGTNNTCGTKNFLNMLGFAFGQPVLALLAMRQNRLLATIGAIQWLVLAGVLLMTQNKAPTLFYRNMVNCKSFPSRQWNRG
jgi:hypothetical protein